MFNVRQAQTQMLVADRARFDAGFSGHWHDHSRSQVIYPEHGVMVLHTEAGHWITPPLQACWLPAGVVHKVETSRGLDMVSVYCQGAWLRRLPRDPCVVTVSPLLREVIRAIPDAQAAARLRKLAILFADEMRVGPTPPLFIPQLDGPLLSRLAAGVLNNPGDDRPLAQWSKVLGVSSRTIAREFQRRTSLSFSAYRRQVRLKAALVRLAEGELVTKVGLELGFGSASNFIRAFRSATGLTPGAYFKIQESQDPGEPDLSLRVRQAHSR